MTIEFTQICRGGFSIPCRHDSDRDGDCRLCINNSLAPFDWGKFTDRMRSQSRTKKPEVREFHGGAIRDLDDGKLDYEGYLSPLVLRRYAEYMRAHQQTAAGFRAGDNWKNGFPLSVYMKSMWRHFMEVWTLYSHYDKQEKKELTITALCALLFNVMGYLHELLKPVITPAVKDEKGNV